MRLIDYDKIEWLGCMSAYECPYKDRECKDCTQSHAYNRQVMELPIVDVLEQITDEIRQIVDEETEHDEKWARGLHYSLCIIDKYKGDKE